MGNNKQFKLNDAQMQEFFNDWEQAFAEGTPKNIFCENESIKFGVELSKSDLNYWLKKFNPTLFESTKLRLNDNATPRAPRERKPRIENKSIVNDATVQRQLNMAPRVYSLPQSVCYDEKENLYFPIFSNDQIQQMDDGIIFEEIPQNVLKDIYNAQLKEQQRMAAQEQKQPKIKIDNTGSIKIACTKFDERVLKNFAMLKDATIKQIILDALKLYYAQDDNTKAYEKAIELLKEIY